MLVFNDLSHIVMIGESTQAAVLNNSSGTCIQFPDLFFSEFIINVIGTWECAS